MRAQNMGASLHASNTDPAGAPAPAVIAISTAAIIVIAAYIGAQMLADIASLKIGVVFGLAVDMGTFIYPSPLRCATWRTRPSANATRRRWS
jgi:xanthine/uracil permease